jgi:heme-degrading monooxygenase HmoA
MLGDHEMSNGVVISVRWTFNNAEGADAFCASLPTSLKETAAQPGFRSIRVLQNGHTMLIIQHWDSQGQFDDYLAWRQKNGSMAATVSRAVGPPVLESWSIVTEVGR